MSSDKKPAAYMRPELPPPDALRERTTSLRASNDRLAASVGESRTGRFSMLPDRPVAPSELAATIKRQNDARVARSSVDAEQEAARAELLLVFQNMHDARFTEDDAEMFVSAMREYLTALQRRPSIGRSDSFRSMRESVASLRESVAAVDRYRSGER
jgi:hypothetical protein